jgi:NAD dependent epimerase/dehydratase family
VAAVRVLAGGASGFVGSRLCPALAETGHDAVAMTRHPGCYDGTDVLSAHLRSRREVEKLLRCGGIPVTVLRAGIIVGHGGISWELTRQLVEHLPVMVTPKWVSTPTEPIAADNAMGCSGSGPPSSACGTSRSPTPKPVSGPATSASTSSCLSMTSDQIAVSAPAPAPDSARRHPIPSDNDRGIVPTADGA